MEEVTYELSFVLFTNTLEELGVHLLLKELIHVDLEVSLEEGLLSQSNLMHVGVHAHGLDFSHHLSLGLELGSLGRSGH